MIVWKLGSVAIPGAARAAKTGSVNLSPAHHKPLTQAMSQVWRIFCSKVFLAFWLDCLGTSLWTLSIFVRHLFFWLFFFFPFLFCFGFLFFVVKNQNCFKLLFWCCVKNPVVWPIVQLCCPFYSQAVNNWAFGEEILLRGASSCGCVFCRLW